MIEPQSTMADLGSAHWPDLAESAGLVLLVPVGSCEQHGPHLPFDTDTRVAEAVARSAASASGCVVAPAVTIGASGEHRGFAGTLSIGTDVLTDVLVEIGRSALPVDGGPFAHVVFVNGHGGNAAALAAANSRLIAESRSSVAWSPRIDGADAHAGRTETSLLLHLAPESVGEERPVGDLRTLSSIESELRSGGVATVSDNGVLGDATGATAAEGAELLETMVDDLCREIERLRGAS